jgi:SET domain-containing protein
MKRKISRRKALGRKAWRRPSAKTPRKPYRVGRSATGLGLFAIVPIDKGAFIIAYRGRRITNAEAERLEARGSRYMYEMNSRWTMDGSSRRNIARYANHSCRPNAESDVVKGNVILRAIKAIAPGDEITYDYGKEYFDLFLKPAGCKCVKCAEQQRKRRAPRTRGRSNKRGARKGGLA